MKEDFLHYVWKFRKFDTSGLSTVDNEILFVIKEGQHNQNSGPDFFNAQVEMAGQLWAGNVEIHIKSSDWYTHGHHNDPAFDNVILHVVWQHDSEIYRKDGAVIPTLVLKEYVFKNTLERYQKLFSKHQLWINCEKDFEKLDTFTIENWLERLYFERLQQKETFILNELKSTQNHWESLLFRMLCRNFGLNVNGESFFSIAKSVDFSVVKKCSQSQFDMEALLFGQASLLDESMEDGYFEKLKVRYHYLRHKFNLENSVVIGPKFFRLRPPNFPTLRLSQLSVLYAENRNLFSEIISINKMEDFYAIFKIAASEYWDLHYNFGLGTFDRKKRLSKSFVDLLVINTIIPVKFCYASQSGKDVSEEILALASEIASEENSIVKKFNSLMPVSGNAYQSQALLQLKNEYCDKNKCLQCAVGNFILKE